MLLDSAAFRFSKDRGTRIIAWIGRHPTIILSLPSLYLLLFYPILWKDIDALGQLIWPVDSTNILHYPPLYCFSGRIPFWIGDLLEAAFLGKPLPVLNIFSEQRPGIVGLYTLIFTQHLALVFALSIFLRSAAKTALGRGLVVLSLISASSLYVQEQCAGSESFSVSAIILMVAFGLRAFAEDGHRAWIAFALATFLVVGTRHINIVLAIWLPLTLTGIMIWRGSRQRSFDRHELVRIIFSLLCAVVALLTNTLLAKSMIERIGQEYHSTLGLTLSDRIEAFTNKLSAPEKEALVAKLLAAERDPTVRLAITTQAEKGSLHSGLAAAVIQDAVRQNSLAHGSLESATDRVILQEALSYFKSMHPKLVRIILADWGHGYLRVDNSKLSLTRFLSTRTAARMSEENPQMWEALNQLHVVDSSAANRGVDRASRDLYLNLGGPIPMIVLVIANIALGIVLARHGRAECAWLALCLVATGSILYFVNCVCVYYNDRYVLPLFVCNIAAWGIQLGRFTDDSGVPPILTSTRTGTDTTL
jgi:hypothetical protein